MPSLPITTAALAATLLASTLPLVSAHGYISGIVSDGKYYSGTSPSWTYAQTKPDTPGWYANNQDNGFVAPSAYASGDITCHKGATVGGAPVPVTAGKSVDLQWNTWPESHHGPVITYMAAVSGEFSAVDKANLKWFKVTEGGLEDGSASPGVWATDSMMGMFLEKTKKKRKMVCWDVERMELTDDFRNSQQQHRSLHRPLRPQERQLRRPPRNHRPPLRWPGRWCSELPTM